MFTHRALELSFNFTALSNCLDSADSSTNSRLLSSRQSQLSKNPSPCYACNFDSTPAVPSPPQMSLISLQRFHLANSPITGIQPDKMSNPTPRFWAGPLRYMRWSAREKPAYFYSVLLGATGPLMLATVPPIQERLGYKRAVPIPMTYPGMVCCPLTMRSRRMNCTWIPGMLTRDMYSSVRAEKESNRVR